MLSTLFTLCLLVLILLAFLYWYDLSLWQPPNYESHFSGSVILPYVDCMTYYTYYHGHRVDHLNTIAHTLRQEHKEEGLVYLVGDSVFDNKHWLFNLSLPKAIQGPQHSPAIWADAVMGYESILSPSKQVKDVCYHLNLLGVPALNCAVEESTIHERISHGLTPPDKWLVEHLTSQDTLVVSLGGNDVALKPTMRTLLSMFSLFHVLPQNFTLGNGWRPGYDHLIEMYTVQLRQYLERLTVHHKPRKILVCMIYFPDQDGNGYSWANTILEKMNYNTNPEQLQNIIRYVYEQVTHTFQRDGWNIQFIPLFEVMDGSDTNDYVQRVEPSVHGAEKMADLIYQKLQ